MKLFQYSLTLPPARRGFHLITAEVVRAAAGLRELGQGLCQVFIQHTSASLTINENADPTVRRDFETFFNKAVRENDPDFLHNDEGPDDMPAHLKASLLGSSVLVPVTGGRLNLGTWQGIYLCEHRNYGSSRTLVITCWGE
jgi:secondary thiamine-phosphate synthase enzyme